MATIGDIRLRNLEFLVQEAGGAATLAERVGSSDVYISQLRKRAIDHKTSRPRQVGEKLARRLEAALHKPKGWMDVDHANQAPATHAAEPVAQYKVAPRQWPFQNVSPERYAALPARERGRIEGYVEKLVMDFEATQGAGQKSRHG